MPRSSSLWASSGIVRFGLALVVAGHHAVSFWSDSVSSALSSCDSQAAVIGFLVLSGYSIASSIEREPSGYMARRALRILPLYWLAIAATAACMIGVDLVVTKEWVGIPHPHWFRLLGNALFLQGFACGTVGANGVVWSLSIEVLFYALAPWLRQKSTGYVVLLGSLSAAFFITLGLQSQQAGLLYGCQAAWIGWAWLLGFVLYRLPSVMAGILALVVPSLLYVVIGRWSYPFWPLPFVGVALALGLGDRLPVSLTRIGDWLGAASYPLYLIHMPVFIGLTRIAQHFWNRLSLPGTSLIAAAIITAVVLDWAYDRPMKHGIRWVIGRWSRSRTASSPDRAALVLTSLQ